MGDIRGRSITEVFPASKLEIRSWMVPVGDIRGRSVAEGFPLSRLWPRSRWLVEVPYSPMESLLMSTLFPRSWWPGVGVRGALLEPVLDMLLLAGAVPVEA